MRLDDLTIALRPRSGWEATDLGIALVRAHARRIWSAWAIVTLPFLVVFNMFGWWLDVTWLALLAMWWLKPAFDRIVLFVLSRAVFGATPTLLETLHAQRHWGWRGIVPWLTWRRLHPGRAMLLPVDLLEGLTGKRRRERTSVLSRAQGGTNMMLTLIGTHLEAVLSISVVLLALLFVPEDFLSDSAKAMWDTLVETPPMWAQLVMNAIWWLGTSLVEPFFIGAGFGLYLNRRTQLEAWDIELSFRRMAQRLARTLATGIATIALVLAIAASPIASAKENADQVGGQASRGTKAAKSSRTPTLPAMLGSAYDPRGKAFSGSVKKAYENTDLNPHEARAVWKERNPKERSATNRPVWADAFALIFSIIAKSGLWILLGALIFVIVRTREWWLPFFGERFVTRRKIEATVVEDIAAPVALPDDIAGAARALWQRGEARAALALLYRGAVRRLVDALGRPLPAGATESECLRAARALRDDDALQLFTRVVRCWQSAAYAHRLPANEAFEALLRDWDAPPPRVTSA
jgi:hypothetical protein